MRYWKKSSENFWDIGISSRPISENKKLLLKIYLLFMLKIKIGLLKSENCSL